MTDNEIIKALPKILYGGHGCIKCEYAVKKGDDRCGLKGCRIARDALDLINRQKAEIEAITEKFNCQQTVYSDLSKIIKEQANELKTAKSEAIREFEDAIKIAIKTRFSVEIENQNPHLCLIDTLISDLVKERVGEDNG